MNSPIPAPQSLAFATRVGRPFDALMARATRISFSQAWTMIAASVILAGLADRASGPDAWWGPIYLLIICLTAWARGWGEGIAAGLACSGVAMLANGFTLYPVPDTAFGWNFGMRFVAVMIIVVLMASVRRSYDREWERARSDALTGALNKQGFDERTSVARDKDRWGILTYVDLDGLKQVNDRYGHAAGDQTLCAFAQGVARIIRRTDIFARIGGDEFLLFFSVDSDSEAHSFSRQLHERMNHILNRLHHPIACSMGVLVLKPNGGSVTEAHVQLADRLMYEAKREGAALRISTEGQPDVATRDEIAHRPSLAA